MSPIRSLLGERRNGRPVVYEMRGKTVVVAIPGQPDLVVRVTEGQRGVVVGATRASCPSGPCCTWA